MAKSRNPLKRCDRSDRNTYREKLECNYMKHMKNKNLTFRLYIYQVNIAILKIDVHIEQCQHKSSEMISAV